MSGQPSSIQRIGPAKDIRQKETLAPVDTSGNFIKHDRKAPILILTAE
jgi:hypothetical protein